MADIRIDAAASRDFEDSFVWYAERSEVAALGFEAEFERTLKAIEKSPGRFPLLDKVHRYCSLQRYPFQVIYTETIQEIVIVVVAHAKRRLGYWKDA
jgi:toxin ParE1/3/4